MISDKFAPTKILNTSVPAHDIKQWDVDAINGRNLDLPKFKHHEAVITLCRHFVPVYRKRVDAKSLEVVKDENGEEIWIVGEYGEMPTSEMLELAREYRNLPRRFR